MSHSKLKKLRKHISSINFDYIEQEECEDYRKNSGEYDALKWLCQWLNLSRASRKTTQPFDIVRSMIRNIRQFSKRELDFIYTLLPYC